MRPQVGCVHRVGPSGARAASWCRWTKPAEPQIQDQLVGVVRSSCSAACGREHGSSAGRRRKKPLSGRRRHILPQPVDQTVEMVKVRGRDRGLAPATGPRRRRNGEGRPEHQRSVEDIVVLLVSETMSRKIDVSVEEIAKVVLIFRQQCIPERSVEHIDDMAVSLNLGKHRAAKNRRACRGNRRSGAKLHATTPTEPVQEQTVDNIVDGFVPQAAHHAAERV